MNKKAHCETAWVGQRKDERPQSASEVKDLLFTSSIGLCVRVLFYCIKYSNIYTRYHI